MRMKDNNKEQNYTFREAVRKKIQFLAALAALGLPWSLTHLLTLMSLYWIQSLSAFQTKQKPFKIDQIDEKT